MHGGKAPQVQKKAAERLAELVHPAIDRLMDLLSAESEMVSLLAVKEALERGMPKESGGAGHLDEVVRLMKSQSESETPDDASL